MQSETAPYINIHPFSVITKCYEQFYDQGNVALLKKVFEGKKKKEKIINQPKDLENMYWTNRKIRHPQ